ncbi:hybrid sensor histidine kinase/response regulator [Methylobacterium sp. yr596]|uniref:hybrid sensor histidine kinase/response regulator n=1 Tax=Methylobacterium sp. yr596 TaxID=1761800 RepID=UPI0008F3D1C4|nr:hybrid sensor histidine kinase/response regulator [Methylobacterium sp. yr596]SFE91530.1 PAS domain S-box-containing protein [Methylobacterium sp. yr596]
MALRMRAHDWEATALGPVAAWPMELAVTVRTMLRAATPMAVYWGSDLAILYNDAWGTLVGGKHPGALGRPARDVFPEAWNELGPLFARVLRGEDAVEVQDQRLVLDRNGTPEDTWFTYSLNPIPDAEGQVVGVLNVAQEMTGRVRAASGLVESEERFRSFAENSADVLWIADPAGGRLEYLSPAYEHVWGDRRELVMADLARWASLVHPEDRERASAAMPRLLSGETCTVEYRIVRADDGGVRHIRDTGFPIRDAEGGLRRLGGIAQDVTEEHAREEALERRVAESTAEHDRVWRNSRDLLVVVGADGVFRAVNPAWKAILGHDPAEVVGRSFQEFIWPEDGFVTRTALSYAAAADDLTAFENRYRHRDGTPRWISWHTAAEGDVVYAYGRDVTAEKTRAAALAEAEEALRQSQKMEAIGQLTGGVAHDFNNLLTIIRWSVDFLRRPDLPEARKARYLDAVSDTVARAAKLTGQLLSFARRQALRPETFDVIERLRGVVEMLDSVTGARIRIVAEMPEATCFVHADVSQFETALVNMAVNARDAMDGEGTLTLRLACGLDKPAIRGHAEAPGPFAAISLSDTGCGIPPEALARIFEPFFTTKEVGKGTGLGLSQVFGFAKQSGGDVDVASTPGRGTMFTLYLPEVEPAKSEEPGPAEVETATGGAGQRVLVVEDNVEVGRFATRILEDLDYRTTWAANAAEALGWLGEDCGGFDAVFSDVVMPGMNGVELAREVQRRRPDLPVVLASGYSHVLAREGSHGFELLHKPYSTEQLSRVLQRAMARMPR